MKFQRQRNTCAPEFKFSRNVRKLYPTLQLIYIYISDLTKFLPVPSYRFNFFDRNYITELGKRTPAKFSLPHTVDTRLHGISGGIG